MSDHEFENYLMLISRLLRLSRNQRQAIGEELRDHFESRLAELMGRGIANTEAVRLALEEFGDAVGLAAHFSTIAQNRKRRIIMRCTVASIASVAAALVVALCMWPDSHSSKVINRAVADSPDKPQTETAQNDLDKLAKLPDSRTAKVEAELNNKFAEFEFQGVPLTDVLIYIHDKYLPTSQFQLDNAALKDAGIDPSTTLVTIGVKDVHLKTAVDLILGPFDLGYYIRDGLLIATTKEKVQAMLETRIYDCREILAADTGQFRGRTVHHSENQQTNGKKSTKGDEGGGSSGGGPTVKDEVRTPVDDLIEVITTSVEPQTWMESSGPGTICQYGGLLIVNANPEVQSQVADLLDKLSTRLASRTTN
jgi:hypothetical protein